MTLIKMSKLSNFNESNQTLITFCFENPFSQLAIGNIKKKKKSCSPHLKLG
jgi:hypothetical protein